MPTTYTHDIFGKEVYEQLPDEIKKVIRSGKSLYLTGLHGPDILFYHLPFLKNKIYDTGMQMHQKESADFFCRAIVRYQEEPSDLTMAYILGFGCHFILDSTCHPYVSEYEKSRGVSHAEIETELDRYYMEREGKNPFTYKPAVSICITKKGCETISKVLGGISEKQIYRCLRGMKFYTGLLVCKNETKRKALLGLMKLLGCYPSMEGQIMRKEPDPACEISTDVLRHLYQEALDEAVEALKNLYDCMQKEGKLSERFNRNFE
ncbi:MAG: zinc dependent phospholipase C family protein [Blautia sp.]|nr:zinc dependent phospholipase C family protein [Blautia sp.]